MGRSPFGPFLMGPVCAPAWGPEVGPWSDSLLSPHGLGAGAQRVLTDKAGQFSHP